MVTVTSRPTAALDLSAPEAASALSMEGFIRRSIPLFLRRSVTMVPALAILGLDIDPTRALVISQVVLSFGIPFALIPLVLLTARGNVMGAFVNHRATTILASIFAAVIVSLNGFLLYQTFFGG
jgi:manganese transport protein